MIRKQTFAVCLAAAWFLTGCAVNPVSGRAELALMSEEQEIAVGREEHPNIVKQFGEYADPALQAYVQKVGEELAAKSHRTDLIYRFTVLDSPEVNAFALPGGYVYITRGLLAYLNSEDELAAVLGHEIGHVTARHSVRQISAATAANLGFSIGAILLPELRNRATQDLFNILGTALLRGYGRDMELEADRLGAEYLARSDRPPEAMIDVIRVLKGQEQLELRRAEEEKREARVYHGVFSTHPDNDERLQQVVGEAEQLRRAASAEAPKAPFVQRLDGLVFGQSASQGILRGRTLYHRDLDFAIDFPEAWTVDNQPSRLIAVAPNREGVLQVTVEERNKRISPREFLVSRGRLEGLAHGEALELKGLEGYTGIAPVRSDRGSGEGRVAVIYHGNRAYMFLGAAKRLEMLDPAFLATIRSFRRLEAAEQELAEPLRLRAIRAKKGTTFATLAAESRIHRHAEEQLRLLNAMYPSGEPEEGEVVKVVQ